MNKTKSLKSVPIVRVNMVIFLNKKEEEEEKKKKKKKKKQIIICVLTSRHNRWPIVITFTHRTKS